MKERLRIILGALLALGALSCAADQNDERLNGLFTSLISESASAPEAMAVTDQIWKIWLETGETSTQAHLDRGIRLMNERNYDGALTEFNAVIESQPGFAEGWNKRATLYFMMGEVELSAADVKQTLQLEPRHFGALSGLGLLYGRLERPKAAIQAFEEALGVNPWLPGPRRNIAVLKAMLEEQSTSKPSI